MVARRQSKRDALAAVKLTKQQQQALVDDMMMSDADRDERAMAAPRKPMPGTNIIPNTKGNKRGGRQKGTPNKIPNIIKEAGVLAAEMAGYDGHGQAGLVGYLYRCSQRFPKEYLAFLGKILPHQVVKQNFNFASLQAPSSADIVAQFKAQGLPIEHLALFQLTQGDSPMKEVNPRPRREPITIEKE